jgi:hypothetical protein
MKFTNNANMNFSSFKGYITISYAELVEIFGRPKYGPNADLDKTTCEWALEFEDGTKASIYDYKTSSTPMREYAWHIGGYDEHTVDLVTDTVAMHRDRLVRMIREHQTV